jgi:predicted transcriptional regulator
VLYELEGKTIPAIATLLGVTAVTVRWHLSRGRKDLARIIGQEGRERQERQEGQEGQDGQACAPKLGDTGERRRDG